MIVVKAQEMDGTMTIVPNITSDQMKTSLIDSEVPASHQRINLNIAISAFIYTIPIILEEVLF